MASWCSWCKEEKKHTPAVAHCPDCEECFCEKHLVLHARIKATSTHVVIHIEGAALMAFEQRPVVVFCKIHPSEEIKGFCDRCITVICGSCIFGDHKGHTYRSVAEVVVEKKSELSNMLVVLAGFSESVAEGVAQVELSETTNVETTAAAILLVEKLAREFRARVDAAEALLKQDIKKLGERKGKEQLQGQKLGLQFSQCEVHNLHIAATEALACGDFSVLLVLFSNIAPRFAEIQRSRLTWPLQACTDGAVHFQAATIEAVKLGFVVDGDLLAASAAAERGTPTPLSQVLQPPSPSCCRESCR